MATNRVSPRDPDVDVAVLSATFAPSLSRRIAQKTFSAMGKGFGPLKALQP